MENAPSRMRGGPIVGAVLLTACALAFWFLRPLDVPAQHGHALEFVDRNGLALGTVLARDGRHAAWVPLDAIAPAFVDAALAAEDARFWRHGALDPRSAARAVARAVASRSVPRGASTITMQLARILEPVDDGLRGRFGEVLGALRVENALSKRRILENYCNAAPMGGNLYGVEAAALTYFGIHASDLDVAQAALLAAIPNDPTGLNPYEHRPALVARAHAVLARMVAAGRLSALEAARAAGEDMQLRPRGNGIVAAPHALFWLAALAPTDATAVGTTIDRPLQRFVEEQLRSVVRSLAAHEVRDAAALVVDNRSGDILAYAGSPDYFSDDALGRNDGVEALRQPGSALKPFLYELALERRTLRPNSILLDAPVAYALPGSRLYAPLDYDGRFFGPVRVRLALANSLNVPAVRTLERVGVPAFLGRLHALGFAHLRRSPDFYGLGLTLGGGEVSLYELTRAYVTLARGGRPARVHAAAFDAGPPAAATEAGNPAWSLVTDILSDRHARAAAFGVDSVLAMPFPTAVKTGTSSDFRDTWTVGFSSDYTVGVWVGNFDGRPMRDVSGVSGAGPLWNRIMLRLHEHREPNAFARPAGYRRVPICARTGLTPKNGCGAVVAEWLDPQDRAALHAAGSTPASFAIAFPHDGDRFALLSGAGAQRIDVELAPAAVRGVAVFLDGRALAPTSGALTFALRLGPHVVVAQRGRERARARIEVVLPPEPAHPGFSDAR